MSKRRNTHTETPRILKFKTNLEDTAASQNTSYKIGRSSLSDMRKKTMKTEVVEFDKKLSTVYNRNIAKFRDLVSQNDKTLLPFLSSLRDSSTQYLKNNNKKLQSQFPFKTKLQPFKVADKQTCNQRINKDLADIKGRTKRISNAFYRWHNKSGQGIKNNCVFQSTLRETSLKFYKNNTFKNIFKSPLQKPKVQKRFYTQSELICPKQLRLFTVQS